MIGISRVARRRGGCNGRPAVLYLRPCRASDGRWPTSRKRESSCGPMAGRALRGRCGLLLMPGRSLGLRRAPDRRQQSAEGRAGHLRLRGSPRYQPADRSGGGQRCPELICAYALCHLRPPLRGCCSDSRTRPSTDEDALLRCGGTRP